MAKLIFESPDLTSQNIDKIAALFPNCVTEMRGEDGKIKRRVNFGMLRQLLFLGVVDGEFYLDGQESLHCGSRQTHSQITTSLPGREQKL